MYQLYDHAIILYRKNPFEKLMGKGEFGTNYGIIRQKESIVAIIG